MDSKPDHVDVTRVLVVDDNANMRETISLIINGAGDLRVCGEAHCISEALRQCEELQPDLALIDMSLKGELGLDLIRHLSAMDSPVRSVAFSLHDEPQWVDGARQAGARGYASKGASPKELLASLRSVRDGHNSFPTS